MNITPATQARAAKVLGYLREFPHLHNQSSWVEVNTDDQSLKSANISTNPDFCNTTMCVAGTVQWLEYGRSGLRKFMGGSVEDAVREAGELIGLDDELERGQLFFTFNKQATLNMLEALAAGDAKAYRTVIEEYNECAFGEDDEE